MPPAAVARLHSACGRLSQPVRADSSPRGGAKGASRRALSSNLPLANVCVKGTGAFLFGESACQRVKKASQSLPPAGGKGILIIFCRGAPQGGLSCPFGAIHLLYLTENTTQAASVRFVRQGRTNRARGRLQSFCQKRAKPFFDSLSPRRHLPAWAVLV